MEYCRAVMGCKVSSSTSVTAINKLFHDMIHTEIHYLTLRKMFERLKKAKLMLGQKKLFLCNPNNRLFRHTLSYTGFHPLMNQELSRICP